MKKQDIEFEKKLIKIGYKRKWLSDKSGYWMSKITKNYPLKGLYFISNIETEKKSWNISIERKHKRPEYNEYVDSKMKYSEKEILKLNSKKL